MSNIGSELGNLGAASSAQAQQFHDAAMAAGAEHLRASSVAVQTRGFTWRRVLPYIPVAIVAGIIVALLF